MTMPSPLPRPSAPHPSRVPVPPDPNAPVPGSLLPCGCYIPAWRDTDAVLCPPHEAEAMVHFLEETQS